MRIYRHYRISDSARLVLAGLLSLALHVLLLFFVRYVQPAPINLVSQTRLLQVMLEEHPEAAAQLSGIPLASEDSAGEAKIGVQDNILSPQNTLAAVEPAPGDQPGAETSRGFITQKILAMEKLQKMKIAEQAERMPDLLVTKNPDHGTPESPEIKEGALLSGGLGAPAPSVAKPVAEAIPSVEKLVSSEPIPGERHEKIVLVEPVQGKLDSEKPDSEKPGRSVDESKPAKVEEPKPAKAEEAKQAGIEEVKPVRVEEAKSARTEAVAGPKTLSAEGGKPEVFRAKAPGDEASRKSELGIPLIKKIVMEDGKSTQPAARRKSIVFKEQDFRYVMYIEGLRLKLERIGSMNYPAGENLSGALSVKISIRSDGSLEDFSIVQPSRYEELNAGAEKIVRMSAPFSPLPEDIRRETDVLSITIKWTFSRSSQSFD